ncbi:sulfotransferase family 2 domain-containing protein [Roseovarius sp. D22-M7]|uniref:sulfotransferase family 2 domain-containing protein n=1 Tax=Roseovarius sp. D22-M7 TaxID=3127116 RepID=UPI00301059E8
MYSAEKKCIFVHQRKAAGTSIKTLFPDATAEFNDGILDPNWNTDSRITESFKFTVIRNPWDRFVSGWKYLRSTRNRSIEDVLLNLPNESFLEDLVGSLSFSARYHYAKEHFRRSSLKAGKALQNQIMGSKRRLPSIFGHNYRHITRQQYETIIGPDGKLAVDAVFFVEALDEGIEFLSSQIDIDPTLVRKRNILRHDDYRDFFDDRTGVVAQL